MIHGLSAPGQASSCRSPTASQRTRPLSLPRSRQLGQTARPKGRSPSSSSSPSTVYTEVSVGSLAGGFGGTPFTFTCKGKNASSSAYKLDTDYIKVIWNDANASQSVTTSNGLNLSVDASSKKFNVTSANPSWTIGGTLPGTLYGLGEATGTDLIGSYKMIAFHYDTNELEGRSGSTEREENHYFSNEVSQF